MLKDVEGIEFKAGDKIAIKKEVRGYMKKNCSSDPRIYKDDPYFMNDMWKKVKELEYLTVKKYLGSNILKIEEERLNYDVRWFEYYSGKLEGVEEF